MNLLIHCAAPFDPDAGVPKVALNVGSFLEKAGIRIHFVFLCGAPAPHDNYMPFLEKNRFLRFLRHTPLSAFFFWRYLRSKRFDLIHSHTPEAGFDSLVALRLSGEKVPVAVTLHGLDRALTDEWKTEVRNHRIRHSFLTQWYLFWSNFKAAYCFSHTPFFSSISPTVDAEAKQYFGKSTRVIQNGVDFGDFFPEKEKAGLRKKLGLPLDKKIVLFVGDNAWRKGLYYLAIAVENLPKEYCLVVAGLSSQPADFPAGLHDQNRIFFTGKHSPKRLCDYYNAADVLCNPALNEGFGLVYLEALACGLPVIACSHTGAEDFVIAGKQGLFVEKRNIPAISEAIAKLCSGNFKPVLPPDFKEQFSWKTVGQNYNDWLLEIASFVLNPRPVQSDSKTFNPAFPAH